MSETMADPAALENLEKERANKCMNEIQAILDKYECHPAISVTLTSGGDNRFVFHVETDTVPRKK